MSSESSASGWLESSEIDDSLVGDLELSPAIATEVDPVTPSDSPSVAEDCSLVKALLLTGIRAPFHFPRLAIPQNLNCSGYPPHTNPLEIQRSQLGRPRSHLRHFSRHVRHAGPAAVCEQQW